MCLLHFVIFGPCNSVGRKKVIRFAQSDLLFTNIFCLLFLILLFLFLRSRIMAFTIKKKKQEQHKRHISMKSSVTSWSQFGSELCFLNNMKTLILPLCWSFLSESLYSIMETLFSYTTLSLNNNTLLLCEFGKWFNVS